MIFAKSYKIKCNFQNYLKLWSISPYNTNFNVFFLRFDLSGLPQSNTNLNH